MALLLARCSPRLPGGSTLPRLPCLMAHACRPASPSGMLLACLACHQRTSLCLCSLPCRPASPSAAYRRPTAPAAPPRPPAAAPSWARGVCVGAGMPPPPPRALALRLGLWQRPPLSFCERCCAPGQRSAKCCPPWPCRAGKAEAPLSAQEAAECLMEAVYEVGGSLPPPPPPGASFPLPLAEVADCIMEAVYEVHGSPSLPAAPLLPTLPWLAAVECLDFWCTSCAVHAGMARKVETPPYTHPCIPCGVPPPPPNWTPSPTLCPLLMPPPLWVLACRSMPAFPVPASPLTQTSQR